MCGIVGVVSNAENVLEDTRGSVEGMLSSMFHRGPDERDVVHLSQACLGHVRLSIIDIAGGKQPMRHPTRRLWITYNGEIFNFLDLRNELMARGAHFTSRSDTEVLLHLYAAHGPSMVHKLNGQWALAIWDEDTRELFLSRDRLGVRPLHYTEISQGFAFASEVKALLRHQAVGKALDLETLDEVFTTWAPLPGKTMFRGISELLPGHSLIRDARGGVRIMPHWQPSYSVRADGDYAHPDRCAQRLLEHLVRATDIRLSSSDVPVAAYLSGGIDSTVIAAIAKRICGAPLQTFSIGFDSAEYDEGTYQQAAVDALGTQHHTLTCRAQDICDVFPDVVWHTEKPLLRTGPAPMFLLSRFVRRHGFKVVLTGEGADEMLGGYDIFKENKIRRFWGRDVASAFRPMLLRRLYPWMPTLQQQPVAYLRAFFQVTSESLTDPLFSHLPRWSMTATTRRLFSRDIAQDLTNTDVLAKIRARLPNEWDSWDAFAQAQYLETSYLLPNYILSSQGDRMSMAHSVEGRFPFLDQHVVDFASHLPDEFKMHGLNEKYILKKAARGLVPDVILRRSKQPYRAPDAAAFFDAEKGRVRADYVHDLLSAAEIKRNGVFNPVAVQGLYQKALAGKLTGTKENMALVGILSTQILMNRYIH